MKDIKEILKATYYKGKDKEGFSDYELSRMEAQLDAHYYQKMLEIIGSDESARVPRKELWKSTGKVAEKFVEMPPARQRNKLRAELRAKLEQEFRRDV